MSGETLLEPSGIGAESPGVRALDGIAVIHQETSLIPALTDLENVFLGIEPRRFLSVAEQEMTEILKAVVKNDSFLIMDEPTDALSDAKSTTCSASSGTSGTRWCG